MRLHRLALPALVLLGALTAFRHAGDTSDRATAFEEKERARLVAHFDSVLVELEQRDVSHLSADRLAARRRHIEHLREYRDAGVFPHNHVMAASTPVFVDEHGTHCAMGYLIARDGRTDMVARIRSGRNLARIHDLASDTALAAWLDRNGITVDEAARIQPQYGGDWDPPQTPPPEPRQMVRSDVMLGSVAYASVATAVILGNLTDPGVPRRYHAGALLGFAGFALALHARRGEGMTDIFAAANGTIAVTSFALAARSASHRRAQIAARGGTAAASRTFSAAPLVTSNSTGVIARLSF